LHHPFRAIAGAAALLAAACLADAAETDPIVGTWVGSANHEGNPEGRFNMRLTFVSPRGGISRYVDIPCGGVLQGGQDGDSYEFTETITFNGPEERGENYCVSGRVRVTVDGRSMTYEWLPTNEGEYQKASGTLKRVGR
jgi:hypothetical protein